MKNKILHIENLSKSFKGLLLFEHLFLELFQSTICSLYGGNGTGKTTLFKMICGFEDFDNGQIHFNNKSIKELAPNLIAKKGISMLWQSPLIFPNHSVIENLLFSSKARIGEFFFDAILKRKQLFRMEKLLTDRAFELLKSIDLDYKSSVKAGDLSFGERKLLGLSMLIFSDSKLWLLDEPFSNVSSKTIDIMSKKITEYKESGGSVLMIEHKTHFADKISDRRFKIESHQIIPII